MTRMKSLLAASALALGTAMIASPASAQEVCDVAGVPSGSATGGSSLACGAGSTASGGFSTAVGVNSVASGQYATAFGDYARATGDDATAIGVNSLATDFGTAVGFSARSTGLGSTAVGIASSATGDLSTAVGYYATATGLHATAIGEYSVATGTDSTALGYHASTGTFNNSVAIGASSVATADNQVTVGGRTISGVNAGTVSATSTEAINGSQLYATNQSIAALSGMATGFQDQLDGLDDRVDHVDRRASAGTAVAIAMGGTTFLPGKSYNLSGNVGTYRGAYAGALNFGALVSELLLSTLALQKASTRVARSAHASASPLAGKANV